MPIEGGRRRLLGGSVLTVDKTGFPSTGICIDGRIQSVDSVLRLLQDAGL